MSPRALTEPRPPPKIPEKVAHASIKTHSSAKIFNNCNIFPLSFCSDTSTGAWWLMTDFLMITMHLGTINPKIFWKWIIIDNTQVVYYH